MASRTSSSQTNATGAGGRSVPVAGALPTGGRVPDAPPDLAARTDATCSRTAPAPISRAEGILRLDGAVTDPTGALDGRSADLAEAVDSTLADHGVQVFVLFVGTTGDLSAADYATQAHVDRWGRLGRSNGCFALAPDDFLVALAQLSGGRLLFADRLGLG